MRRSRSAALLIAAPLALSPVAAEATPVLQATLTAITAWVAPQDTLAISLRVRNTGDAAATSLRVTLDFHEGIQTRSALERTFNGRSGARVARDTVSIDGEIGPGETRPITIARTLPEIPFFRSPPNDRTYPLTVSVSAGDISAPSIDTHMILFSRQAAVPLGIVMVIPLHEPSIYGPRGEVASNAEDFIRSLSEGRLRSIIEEVASSTGEVAVAPTGMTLDALADLSDGFAVHAGGQARQVAPGEPNASAAAQALEMLRRAVARPEVSLIAAPYGAAFLPGLPPARAQAQMGAARATIATVLGRDPLPGWLLPTPAILDDPTLTALVNSGFEKAFLLPESTRRAPTPLTPGAPIDVTGRAGRAARVLLVDEGLSERLGGGGVSDIVARQRFLAETATIMLEKPAVSRAVTAVAPLDWNPGPEMLSGVINALSSAPWLVGTAPEGALFGVASEERLSLAPPETVLEDGPKPPTGGYFAAIRAARQDIDRFADVEPPPEMLARLESRLLISEGLDWWESESRAGAGRDFARGISDLVDSEFAKVGAPAAHTVTLTDRRGMVPLSITSRATYPMRVLIKLESDKLTFPTAKACPSTSPGSCVERVLGPRAQTLEIPTVAEATGTFPLRISIITPNRGILLDSVRLIVRSTAYSSVAIAVTAGAGAFLVLWWIVGSLRRRIG